MPELSYDTTSLNYLRAFFAATGVEAKDCVVVENKVVFLVRAGDIRRVVGPHGERIDRVKELLKKEIQVVEFASDPAQLVLNAFYAFSPEKVEFSPRGKGRHATVTVPPEWKARAIGKEGRNLKIALALVSRHSDVVSVSVA